MKSQIGKKVIVRSNGAGIFFGTLTAKEGDEVQMTSVRKLHYWDGACAVEQLSVDGTSKPNDCRFTVEVKELTITNILQILTCTKKAITNIENVPVWKI